MKIGSVDFLAKMNNMNSENFFKQMFYDIWQGNDINKIGKYYSKHFIEEIYFDKEGEEKIAHTMNYDDIIQQSLYLKNNYKNTTVYFKNILSAENNNIAVNFHSQFTEIKTEKQINRYVAGIWHIDHESKIDHVWAVVVEK